VELRRRLQLVVDPDVERGREGVQIDVHVASMVSLPRQRRSWTPRVCLPSRIPWNRSSRAWLTTRTWLRSGGASRTRDTAAAQCETSPLSANVDGVQPDTPADPKEDTMTRDNTPGPVAEIARTRWGAVLAVSLAIVLAALDLTIVAVALPLIS